MKLFGILLVPYKTRLNKIYTNKYITNMYIIINSYLIYFLNLKR